MTLSVTVTGTGVPQIDALCAGAGVLVRVDGLCLQFDAGRATAMRLAAVGVRPPMLDALFVTHHHSDHLLGLTDLVISRWIEGRADPSPLLVVAPSGPTVSVIERLLVPWEADLALRAEHLGRTDSAQPELSSFVSRHDTEVEVWSHGDVRVLARKMHHEPVDPAVAYRVESPSGSVVISGDTIVCDEMEQFAAGADVVVHEAFRRRQILDLVDRMPQLGHLRQIAGYHADTVALGAMAARLAIPTLVLTHLIPAVSSSPEAEAGFVDDVREAGFEGELIVARDLTTVEVAAPTIPTGRRRRDDPSDPPIRSSE